MSPRVQLSRRYHFSAAHRLHVDALSPGENRAAFGKCNNPFGHGHNYMVEVTFAGSIDPDTGMVVDLATLDAFAASQMLAVFDHANLNVLEAFRDRVSTTENLCVEMWRIWSGFYTQGSSAELVRIRIEETGNNSFEYAGGNQAA